MQACVVVRDAELFCARVGGMYMYQLKVLGQKGRLHFCFLFLFFFFASAKN